MGRHDVLLVSYPMLQIDGEAFAGKLWATLVLDEAQAIKNAAAKRSQAVFALQATFRLAMSGTPIENRLGELWSVMRACNPGLLGTLARFNERFANLIERQHDRGAQRTLKRLIAPFILRRTKAQVLADLPPRTELVLQVQGDDAEKAHYEALRREALVAAEKSLSGDGAGQAHLNILAGLTRLRRAACDPRLVTPTLKRPGAKVTAFAELATELVANGHKALVFSQFVDFLALLREPLDAAGIAYQYLDGSTPVGRAHAARRRVPERRGRPVPDQPEGRRLRPEPDRGRLRRHRRPVVEPGRRGPGQRPRAPHRPAAPGDRLPPRQHRHAGGEDPDAAPDQARAGRQRAGERRRGRGRGADGARAAGS